MRRTVKRPKEKTGGLLLWCKNRSGKHKKNIVMPWNKAPPPQGQGLSGFSILPTASMGYNVSYRRCGGSAI